MKFVPALQSATLVKRYQRFLADVITPDGELMTVHCAATGAMTGCANAGDTIWYSLSDNPKRRYPASWQLTETAQHDWICINTVLANTLVADAINLQLIPELANYTTLRREVPYGLEKSRIDLLLTADGRCDCYVEIKSVTLADTQTGVGYFPDAVTLRGQKHLRELREMARQGKRAILFYLIQHSAITAFKPAAHIDPVYAQLLREAAQHDVEILCYTTAISPNAIDITHRVPCCI